MRRRPRQRRARESVEALVEATRQLLDEGPVTSWSTDAVAERAGVSIGTLYQYFEDKADLVRAVGERHVRGIAEALAGIEPPDASEPSLHRYATTVLEITADAHARDHRLHDTLIELGLAPSLREAVAGAERDARKGLARVAARQRAPDPELAGGMAYDLIERFAHKRLGEASGDETPRLLARYADELAAVLAGKT